MTTLSRRRQYSDSTQRRLVRVARDLFTQNGYAGTSLDAIVAGADVTKGALYHHFDGKQALFEAVFGKIERSATKAVRRAHKRKRDPWEKAAAGLRAFLEVVRTEEYRRIVLQDGPAVLGYARFREREQRTTHDLLREIVGEVMGEHGSTLDPEKVDALTHIFHGALAAAGSYVADSDDPQAASARVEDVIGFILLGMRGQLEAGDATVMAPAAPTSAEASPAHSESTESAHPQRGERSEPASERRRGRGRRRTSGRGEEARAEAGTDRARDETTDEPDEPDDFADLLDPEPEPDPDLEEFTLTDATDAAESADAAGGRGRGQR